ncbi:arginine decarboxylase, partial [Streptococcus salivarius]|nr:arginine decarboxylase [Streptococcus salivarius]
EELDDIHHPEGAIKDAETLAATLYGADRCFFGVNGTTGVIHGMLLGALRPGDKILVPRNSHKSVLGGLILGGL